MDASSDLISELQHATSCFQMFALNPQGSAPPTTQEQPDQRIDSTGSQGTVFRYSFCWLPSQIIHRRHLKIRIIRRKDLERLFKCILLLHVYDSAWLIWLVHTTKTCEGCLLRSLSLFQAFGRGSGVQKELQCLRHLLKRRREMRHLGAPVYKFWLLAYEWVQHLFQHVAQKKVAKNAFRWCSTGGQQSWTMKALMPQCEKLCCFLPRGLDYLNEWSLWSLII